MAAETPSPAAIPQRLCDLNSDARTAVLLDAAGALAAGTEPDAARAQELAELARGLFEALDVGGSGEPAEQLEAQVPGGAVFASRSPRWTLAVVARRQALPSLMLYDLRAVLGELEGGPRIVTREAAA
jgi:hypothetical protein